MPASLQKDQTVSAEVCVDLRRRRHFKPSALENSDQPSAPCPARSAGHACHRSANASSADDQCLGVLDAPRAQTDIYSFVIVGNARQEAV